MCRLIGLHGTADSLGEGLWVDPDEAYGAVTALGHDNAEALRLIKPGFDLEVERQAREDTGHGESITDADLYPDVRPALTALRAAGLWVGIAGNQTARAAELLEALDLPADAIATSGQWGVAKPGSAFYERLITWAPGNLDEIVRRLVEVARLQPEGRVLEGAEELAELRAGRDHPAQC
jgi:phosphoglycolate phosphatase-like HAD superfamily hydrolase